jgi:hypothetical protein
MKHYRELATVLEDSQQKVIQLKEQIKRISDQNMRLSVELQNKDIVIWHLESQSQAMYKGMSASGIEPRATKQQQITDPEKFSDKKEPIPFDQ